MRVFLVGYMGSGKTTIGRLLAKSLGLTFIDMDNYIVDRQGMSIAQIFENYGEVEFRKIESDVINEFAVMDDIVVATGGGAPCFDDNMERIKRAGTIVYLSVSPEGLAKRLEYGREKRPLIRDKNPQELIEFIVEGLATREKFYKQANIVVGCDGYSDVRITEIVTLAVKQNL